MTELQKMAKVEIMGNCYIAGVFGTDVQRAKECRARRSRSFARPTSEYF